MDVDPSFLQNKSSNGLSNTGRRRALQHTLLEPPPKRLFPQYVTDANPHRLARVPFPNLDPPYAAAGPAAAVVHVHPLDVEEGGSEHGHGADNIVPSNATGAASDSEANNACVDAGRGGDVHVQAGDVGGGQAGALGDDETGPGENEEEEDGTEYLLRVADDVGDEDMEDWQWVPEAEGDQQDADDPIFPLGKTQPHGVQVPAVESSNCVDCPCTCVGFDPAFLALRPHYPGRDGARKGRRFEKVSVAQLPAPVSPYGRAIRDLVLSVCVQALRQRDSSPGATESAVKCHLHSTYEQFTSKYASPIQRAASQFLPKTFKEALTLVERETSTAWPTLWRYDMCHCGFVYRCEYAAVQTCPARIPATGAVCGRPRNSANVRPFTFNPLTQFCSRVFADPVRAREFTSWQLPAEGSTKMTDVWAGAAVGKAVESDPTFAAEKGNLFCILVTDPYKVRLL